MDVESPLSTESPQTAPETSRRVLGHLLLLLTLVGIIYGARLGSMPLHGEESRWARGAALMIETGDWVVPRQQKQVFPERPPLNSWAMAAAAFLRGEMDEVAVRLPSVLAMILTTLLVFVYSRSFLGLVGAIAAAGAFATMGQVLQIGRLGESEAVFTMFIAGSLLLWHMGYVARWPAVVMWTVGYTSAALGALTKGIQAPVYFVAAVGLFLLWRRDWRTAFSWSHAAGIGAFVAIVAAWQVPFYLRTDWDATVAVWAGLASDRVGFGGLLEHMATYPLETLGCLLPWSILLMQFMHRPLRASIGAARGHLEFLVIAVAITYPSVWFSVGARGRYYMPLYPLIAIVIGLIVQRSVEAPVGSVVRRGWNRFLLVASVVCVAAGVVISVAGWIPALSEVAQPVTMAVLFAIVSLTAAGTMLWARCDSGKLRAQLAVYALVAFLGTTYTGVVINARMTTRVDMQKVVAEAKSVVPEPENLISFGAVDHRFCYYYRDSIDQFSWPKRPGEVPQETRYFCFHRRPSDTPKVRTEGRGRSWGTTPGTLPFAWEEVVRVGCDSRTGDHAEGHIVIGRVLGPLPSRAETGTRSIRTATLPRELHAQRK